MVEGEDVQPSRVSETQEINSAVINDFGNWMLVRKDRNQNVAYEKSTTRQHRRFEMVS